MKSMLSDRSFSRAARLIRVYRASKVPAIMQTTPQPRPTIVLTTLDRRQTLSPAGELSALTPVTNYNYLFNTILDSGKNLKKTQIQSNFDTSNSDKSNFWKFQIKLY